MKRDKSANSQALDRTARLNGRRKLLSKSLLVSLGLILASQLATAQVTDKLQANVAYSFIVGSTTFPPGTYDFRVMADSDLSVMTISSEDGKTSAEFLIREAKSDHVPQHSELVFNRYGQKEFLSKIFEQGSRIGSAVAEVSRQEQRLQKQGQHPVEHNEPKAGT